ncbi:TonB-dependent receptor [Aliiglaciecola sp. LCG003]|uniref:TonB-dependent receptor plug domain-containing protein n=1 Tax=Aliiglaciecola sp. LCG003 TaxID=3053655 RepID=UPI00257469B8|nr:TonB-dependent receptor [Aliiglaciecola sp. LCG003]WJG09186.1 TonB-dependent receptor [Aliiglaciecola sp. LCG003]
MNLKNILCCVAPLYACSLMAQPEIETLQVTGTRIAKQSQGSYSSLSRSQIEAFNPASTLDLLRRIPNIIIAENGAAGGIPFVSLRGGESNFTLVLIDGVAVNDPTNSRGGGFDFNQINPSAIDRIEVYRGGISAVYGGEAISGVIHIVTRSSAPQSIGVEFGTDEQLNASGTFSTSLDNGVDLLASVSSRKRKSSDFASIDTQQGLFKLGFDTEKVSNELLITFSNSDNVGFAEDSGGEEYALPQIAETRDSEQWLVGLRHVYALSDKTSLSGNLSWLNRQESSNSPGIAEGVLSGVPASMVDSEFERFEVEVFAKHQLNQSTTLVFGVNGRNAEGRNDGSIDFGFPLPVDFVLQQDTRSAFAEAQYEQANYTLDMGLRYDKSDNFDSETSLRIGADYAVSETIQLFAVYNEGFKLPSFFALAHPLIGNADLKPERSENAEVGMKVASQDSQFSILYFDNHYSDLVDFDAELFTSVNRSSVDATGIELSAFGKINQWLSLSADVTYTELEVDDGPSQLRRRPKWFGGVALDGSWDTVTLSLFADFRDKYLDSSIATGLVELGGYAKYGLSGQWQVTEQLTTSFNIENLLAKEYQESVGFVNDEANMRIGMQYTF